MAGGLYSRTVRWLKLALPVIALGLVAAVLLVNQKETFEGGISFTRADLEAMGAGLKVSNPNLSGMTRDRDEYNFHAAEATPSDLELTRVEVSGLTGSVQIRDGIRIYVTAPRADFDLGAQRMEVPEGVSLTTSDGYTFHADRLEADLETAGLTGEGRVRAAGPMGDIVAQRLRIEPADEKLTSAQVIWLEGGVKLVYDPAAAGQQQGD